MDIRHFTTENMVDLLRQYLSENGVGSITVDLRDLSWHNRHHYTTVKRGYMEIPDGVSNSFTNILEIFGRRQYMDVDHGQAYSNLIVFAVCRVTCKNNAKCDV